MKVLSTSIMVVLVLNSNALPFEQNYDEDQLFENESYSFSDQVDIDPSNHVFAVYHESTGSWQANNFHL